MCDLLQQEAGFFLWFHALTGEATCVELAGCGVIAACVSVLSAPASSPSEKSCAMGERSLLHGMPAITSTSLRLLPCACLARVKDLALAAA